ncbi:hypothetical protein GUJ93_ZPchr0014g46639 [Zizania palustris]|uniref:Uncharacterized protein n=1 Tax=Zizania palustris TaxID=103762 RepID=A0A8J5T7Q9_ZIZPA|nr:hypothetical protein GUJ93_ZPchr0014g46639 [Zizania palustris]
MPLPSGIHGDVLMKYDDGHKAVQTTGVAAAAAQTELMEDYSQPWLDMGSEAQRENAAERKIEQLRCAQDKGRSKWRTFFCCQSLKGKSPVIGPEHR